MDRHYLRLYNTKPIIASHNPNDLSSYPHLTTRPKQKLIKERKDLGDALQEILYEPDIFQEDAEGKRMSAIERRVKELDSQIEGILFPNVFKKKLIMYIK